MFFRAAVASPSAHLVAGDAPDATHVVAWVGEELLPDSQSAAKPQSVTVTRWARYPFKTPVGRCVAVRRTAAGLVLAGLGGAPGQPVRWVVAETLLSGERAARWAREAF